MLGCCPPAEIGSIKNSVGHSSGLRLWNKIDAHSFYQEPKARSVGNWWVTFPAWESDRQPLARLYLAHGRCLAARDPSDESSAWHDY